MPLRASNIRSGGPAMVCLAGLLPVPAIAGFIGSALTIEWHFPARRHIFASSTIVVGVGIEFPGQALGPASAERQLPFFTKSSAVGNRMLQ